MIDGLHSRESLLRRREALIAYLKTSVETEDWHAVADAACDLREVDAEIRGWDQVSKELDRGCHPRRPT